MGDYVRPQHVPFIPIGVSPNIEMASTLRKQSVTSPDSLSTRSSLAAGDFTPLMTPVDCLMERIECPPTPSKSPLVAETRLNSGKKGENHKTLAFSSMDDVQSESPPPILPPPPPLHYPQPRTPPKSDVVPTMPQTSTLFPTAVPPSQDFTSPLTNTRSGVFKPTPTRRGSLNPSSLFPPEKEPPPSESSSPKTNSPAKDARDGAHTGEFAPTDLFSTNPTTAPKKFQKPTATSRQVRSAAVARNNLSIRVQTPNPRGELDRAPDSAHSAASYTPLQSIDTDSGTSPMSLHHVPHSGKPCVSPASVVLTPLDASRTHSSTSTPMSLVEGSPEVSRLTLGYSQTSPTYTSHNLTDRLSCPSTVRRPPSKYTARPSPATVQRPTSFGSRSLVDSSTMPSPTMAFGGFPGFSTPSAHPSAKKKGARVNSMLSSQEPSSKLAKSERSRKEHSSSRTPTPRADQAPSPSSQLTRMLWDFDQDHMLGMGSFGKVYKCKRRLDGLYYAVKIQQSKNPREKEHLLREVDALSLFSGCPHVVRYHYAWFEIEKLHVEKLFLVTEFCKFGSLAELRASHHEFSETELCDVLSQIVSAISLMHAKGLVHMDVKPDNILIAEKGHYKIGDFGQVCKVEERHQRDLEINEGDSKYLAAEVLAGDYSNLTKADIFSLGASMYELALGQELPSNGDDYHAIRKGILKPLPSPRFSWEFAALIQAMLHPDPAQRPSAHDLLTHPLLRIPDTTTLTEIIRTKDEKISFFENLCAQQQTETKQLKDENNHYKQMVEQMQIQLEYLQKSGAQLQQASFTFP